MISKSFLFVSWFSNKSFSFWLVGILVSVLVSSSPSMASGTYRRERRARQSGTGCAVSHVGMEMHSEVLVEPSGRQGWSLCAREDARLLGAFRAHTCPSPAGLGLLCFFLLLPNLLWAECCVQETFGCCLLSKVWPDWFPLSRTALFQVENSPETLSLYCKLWVSKLTNHQKAPSSPTVNYFMNFLCPAIQG